MSGGSGSVAAEPLTGWKSVFDIPDNKLGFMYSFRWIPEKPDHGKLYMNLSYAVTDYLRLGVDYRPLTDDVSPLINLRVFPEKQDSWRPALILGMSNDDFGDINSDAYFGTFSKHIGNVAGIDFSPYVGATYIAELEEIRPVGGLHARHGRFSAMFQYSGVDEHASLSYSLGNHTLTFIMFNLKLPGVAYNIKF
ncbi:MAG: hypothetical protein P8J87_16735 [Verrucomicrobiales bacterium]|nr:hypothetical protein [Verrucomicrobiales bacterium]